MITQIEPWIDNSELVQLKRVIKSTYVVENKLTEEFETLTRKLTGSKYAVAMTNGTMALFASLLALGIGKGDEVIIPNITFVATANVVLLAGAVPVLCEITNDTFCIDINKAEELINKKTKAIMPVHLYGQSVDMEKCMKFAKKYNLKIIEDAAQGVGVYFNKKHVGTFGDIGVLSYYGNKTVTCGEGGVALTNKKSIAKKLYSLKNHGREKKGTFIHREIGFNFSFTEMQAAIGIAQMKKLSKIIYKKKQINDLYVKNFSNFSKFVSNVYIDKRCSPVFWFTSILVKNASVLSKYLYKHGIQSRRFFFPLHLQPCYKNTKLLKNINYNFSISEKVYYKAISLPSSYNLSKRSQLDVIKFVKNFYENRY